jgi:hypothetical protein
VASQLGLGGPGPEAAGVNQGLKLLTRLRQELMWLGLQILVVLESGSPQPAPAAQLLTSRSGSSGPYWMRPSGSRAEPT